MLALFGLGANAQAASRVALVIGNAAYTHVPALVTPRNDAEDVAAALRQLGFEVVAETDLDRAGMNAALDRFSRLAEDADIALFYYSGHGMQFGGRNYLLPVDVRLESEADINRFRMVPLDDIMEVVERAHGARILVLDACRSNPVEDQLKRQIAAVSPRSRNVSLMRGLSRESAVDGTLIAYATQSNDTAADGTGRNSPFTQAFLRHVAEPDLDVRQMFFRVQDDVDHATHGHQRPELSISLVGKFSLNPQQHEEAEGLAATPAAAAPVAATPVVTTPAAATSTSPAPAVPAATPTSPAPAAQVASLPPSVPAPAETAASDTDLSRAIQRELKRVGCYDGDVDGHWGERSRAAVKDFNRHAGRQRGAEVAGVTPETLAKIAASAGPVCPVACGRGTVLVNGRCVARGEKKKRVVVRHPAEPAPARAVEPQAGGSIGRVGLGHHRGRLGHGAGALRVRCHDRDVAACKALCALGGQRACWKANLLSTRRHW
jgi:hypothetical protein